eukprot:gene16433-18753_t
MSTNIGLTPHKKWLQIVTTNGVNELFRIYWTFPTARSVRDRFPYVVNTGESVSYRVVVAASGQEFNLNGIWRFSTSASISTTKLNAASTTCCLSGDDGAWGAGNGVIDANNPSSNSFWGLGNLSGGDSNCGAIYQGGSAAPNNPTTKSYITRPLLLGNWETPLVETQTSRGVYSIGDNVWNCGQQLLSPSVQCDIRNATTGVPLAQYTLPWKDIQDVVPSDLTDSVVLVGEHALSAESAASDVALCKQDRVDWHLSYQHHCVCT